MEAAPKFKGPCFAGVLLVAIVAIVLLARWDEFFRRPLLEQGDLAVNALQIHHAKSLSELYGNYSRFEFNHPGPAFFYVYAFGEHLFYDWLGWVPSPGNAHLLAGAILQAVFFTWGVALLRAHVPWRAFVPLVLLAGAVFFGRRQEVLTSIWMPHALALPFFCFLSAATLLAMGQWRAVLPLVVAGGFLVHGHVVMPLFVGSIGMLALSLGFRRSRRDGATNWRGLRWHFVGASLLVAIFLLPLVLDVLQLGARSNLATILGRAQANAGDRLSITQSAIYLLSYEIAGREHDRLITNGGAPLWAFVRTNLVPILMWSGLLLLPSMAAGLLRKRLRVEERALLAGAVPVSLVALLAALVWGMAQAGGARHYNGHFFHGLYFFGAVLLLVLGARWLEARARLASILICAMAALIAAYLLHSREWTREDRGLRVYDAIASAWRAGPVPRSVLVVFDQNDWHLAASVVLELTRKGVPCHVLPWWSYMFQPRHVWAQPAGAVSAGPEVWWIAPAGADGLALTDELALFRSAAPLAPAGGRIDFAPGGNAFRYLLQGVNNASPVGVARTDAPRVEFRFLPQHSRGNVQVTFEAEVDPEVKGAPAAEVFWNGVAIGRVAFGDRQRATVIVPVALWNSGSVAMLSLRIADARARRSPARPNYEPWRAWRVWRVEFDESE